MILINFWPLKDYYKILGIEPSADKVTIKNAYRRLAHQFHPDKNPGNPFAEAQFSLIQEAYATLTHPVLKQQYLEERWLAQSLGQSKPDWVETPPDILLRAIATNQKFGQLDAYRVNRQGLFEELEHHLEDRIIQNLNAHQDADLSHQFVMMMIPTTQLLFPHHQIILLNRLKLIHTGNNTHKWIEHKIREVRRRIFWSRLQPFIIIGLIILLCMVIAGIL